MKIVIRFLMSVCLICLTCLTIALFLGFAIVAHSAEKEKGLVLYLSFDEGAGNVAKDLSGNDNDGKVSKAEWVDGKVGKALKFNGVDAFVEVLPKDAFNITDTVTLAAWIKPNVPFNPVWRGIINTRKSTRKIPTAARADKKCYQIG